MCVKKVLMCVCVRESVLWVCFMHKPLTDHILLVEP